MSELARKAVQPPSKGTAPLKGNELDQLHAALGGGWQVIDEHHLEKSYRFQDFQAALDFTNQVGALAEQVDHHPEICLTWGAAQVKIWTHSVGGLSKADFIFAARCDQFIR